MSLSVARPTVMVPGGEAGGDPRRIRIMLVARFDPSPPPSLAEGVTAVVLPQVGDDPGAPTCCDGGSDTSCAPQGGSNGRGPLGGLPTAPVWRPTSKVSRGPSGLLMLMLCPSRMSTD